MNKTLIVFAALALLAVAPLSQAAQTKIGLVDVKYVLTKSDAGQAAKAKLQAYGKKQGAKLQAKRKKLAEQRKALQKNASIQSDAARKAARKKFEAQVKAFQKTVRKSHAKGAKMQRKLLQPLKADLFDVIQKYADNHGYSIILFKRVVVYAQDGHDLTQEILKAFNAAEAK